MAVKCSQCLLAWWHWPCRDLSLLYRVHITCRSNCVSTFNMCNDSWWLARSLWHKKTFKTTCSSNTCPLFHSNNPCYCPRHFQRPSECEPTRSWECEHECAAESDSAALAVANIQSLIRYPCPPYRFHLYLAVTCRRKAHCVVSLGVSSHFSSRPDLKSRRVSTKLRRVCLLDNVLAWTESSPCWSTSIDLARGSMRRGKTEGCSTRPA